VNKSTLNRKLKTMKTLNLRNSIDRSPLRSGLLFIALALGYFALSPAPNAFGVVPPPDGGYPGFNTAEGQNALLHLTTGTANTALGWLSLENVTTGSFNTGVGAGTLVLNSGDQNTATGAAALLLNTTGSFNTANGALALLNNTNGSGNTATGVKALQNNTTGDFNTATGEFALQANSSGGSNTAFGWNALTSNTIGTANTAIGLGALAASTTGSGNIAIGPSAGANVQTASNVICIGSLFGANVSDTCFIGHIRGVTTINANAIPVVIDSVGQLGTTSSSRRFKREIQSMDKASEAILSLRPVTFHYKSDKTNRPEFGLVAEEVAEVHPDLVVRDDNGELYTVRYDAVNAMLLNEFLKEHRKVEKLTKNFQATVAQQQKEIQALTVRLEEQAAQIQKVSAQLELSKSVPQTVLNDK
jgi:hypothetical protein